MNIKLYTKKGLTFRGAFVVVIFVHLVGLCSLYGYTKYRSSQLKIAREEWKNKIEQRHNADQNEWKNNSMYPPKVVARPKPKVPLETKQVDNVSVLLEKAQDLTETLLTKASTEIDSVLKDSKEKEKIQIANAFLLLKKKQEQLKPKKPANKVVVVSPLSQTTKQIVRTENNRPKPAPKKPVVVSSPPYTPASKPIITRSRYVQTQTNPRARAYTEYDYETQETVQTFYSY